MYTEDYGMVQADLDNIRKNGLINNLNQGGKLPFVEYVSELQNRLKTFAKNPNLVWDDKGSFMGKKRIIYKDPLKNQFLDFVQKTKMIVSRYMLKESQSDYYDLTGKIEKNSLY